METPDGPIRIEFVEQNAFGALNHFVYPAPGMETLNPMCVVANGSGSEIIFTLFQLPGALEEKYAEDIAWVEHDLRTLKTILEGEDLRAPVSRGF